MEQSECQPRKGKMEQIVLLFDLGVGPGGKIIPSSGKKVRALVERGGLRLVIGRRDYCSSRAAARAKIFADWTRLEISTYSFGWCANLASPGPHRIMGAPRAGTKTTASEK
jgi:hypothetical protein